MSKRFSSKTHCLVLAILVGLFSPLAVAQSSLSGAINGTACYACDSPPGSANDSANRSANRFADNATNNAAPRLPVPNAQITLQSAETAQRFQLRTGLSGEFRIPELTPGDYTLTATAGGLADVQLHITVEVGRITEVEIPFSVAAAQEVVEVHAEAPAINTTQPDFASNITAAPIENLPINGRRWSNFALLTPGATLDGDFGLISFRGISGLLNNSTVDGADNNQAFYSEERGRTRISYVISQASVREFQVNTSNFSAEYGRAAGAVINAVTHSGTNHLHGQLFYYMRDNALGATNAFTVVPVQLSPGTWSTEKVKPLDRRQQFGGSVGGPIVHDKLFYFATFDAQRRDYPAIAAAAHPSTLFAKPCVIPTHYAGLNNTNRTMVQICSTTDELYTLTRNVLPYGTPDATAISAFNSGLDYLAALLGPVPRTANHELALAKLDYRITPHHGLSFSYNGLRWNSPGGVQTRPVVDLGTNSFGNSSVRVDTLTARLTSILGSRIVNQLRYSWGRDFESELPQSPAPGEPVGPNGIAPAVSVLSSSNGFSFGTPASIPQRALPDEYRNQFADTVSYLYGRHVVKFGIDANFVHDEMDNLYAANGSYKYDYRANFIADLYQWQNNTGGGKNYSSYTQGFGTPAFAFNTLDGALFVQDDFRALRRLNLSFGLRYDYEALPNPQAPNPMLPATAAFPSDKNNFGPRFGFAWNLTGDGKTALRGGYGIYYGRISNSTISSALTNTGTEFAQRSYRYKACWTYAKNCLNGPIFPTVAAADPFSATQGGNVAVFAPNMQNPQIQQVDLILERQLARDTVISASYLLSLGRELPNFIDINLDPASRTNVAYTFAADSYNPAAQGPYFGHTLTVPVYTGRLNPSFQTITQIRSNVNSSYNALVLQFNGHMSRALHFRLNYTWSHSLDFNQNSTTYTTYNNTLSPVPFTYLYDGVPHLVARPDYGNSNYDIRHRFTGSLYFTPRLFRHSHGFAGSIAHAALDHWSLAPVVHISTGRPFSDNISGYTPIPTCPGCDGFMGTGGQNRLPFLGRNSFRYGNFYNTDLRLSRRIHFSEGTNLEFLAEAFNLLNHQNVTGRSSTLYSVYTPYTAPAATSTLEYDGNFNTPTGAANTVYRERELQLAARLHF